MSRPKPKQSRHQSKRDHVLRTPLENTVRSVIGDTADVKLLVENILTSLDEQNIISYMPQNIVSLLTPYGRVLILLIERPGLTVREMSVFLGVTETNITKAITKLQSEDLIARTKVNGRFEYSIVFENAENHSDIRRLISFISKIITQSE